MEKHGEPEASFIATPVEAEILQSDPGICTRPEEAYLETLANEEPLQCCEYWARKPSTYGYRYFLKAMDNLLRDGLQAAHARYQYLL